MKLLFTWSSSLSCSSCNAFLTLSWKFELEIGIALLRTRSWKLCSAGNCSLRCLNSRDGWATGLPPPSEAP